MIPTFLQHLFILICIGWIKSEDLLVAAWIVYLIFQVLNALCV